MAKKYLGALIDIKLIVLLVIIIAVSAILTMVFSDKVKEFSVIHKKKFFIYLFSFVVIYALVAFLGYNKLFTELSNEFLFYQIASLLFGILNVYLEKTVK
ncbi:TssN family type VI secretion system protein, partial [Flavobacterium gilvum]